MFSDSNRLREIPAPLCGLVFVRYAPENFDCTPLRSVAQVPEGDLDNLLASLLSDDKLGLCAVRTWLNCEQL